MTSTEPRANIISYLEAPRQPTHGGNVRRPGPFHADLHRRSPEAVFGLLSDFQRVVTDLVSRFRGELNSYQGDGVLATFADVAGRADCATRTLRCARKILEQIRALSLDRTHARSPSVSVSIGMQYGQTWTSTITTSRRFGPTLIGDAVNVAARLEKQTQTAWRKDRGG